MIYFASNNRGGWLAGQRFLIDNPMPTVMAAGLAGDSLGHWYLMDDGQPDGPIQAEGKPPYRVPLMSEIEALPWNGLTVASTFSGAGGSCTGYRMAGYRVLWANEFLAPAIESYKANHPDSIMDGRDIKFVRPEEILAACNLKAGELDVFDGSPPCQAFSTAGRRDRGWGKEKTYENGTQQCNEELFFEYIRLLRGLKPRTFVAENVSGLVKGVAKGYFKQILSELKASGYRVTARLLDAKWLGVPQSRSRLIFVGVREDLARDPVHPVPLRYQYTVRDAMPWLTRLSVRQYSGLPKDVTDAPMPTVMTKNDGNGLNRPDSILEGIEPEAWMTRHATGREWEKLAPGQRSSKYFQLKKTTLDEQADTVTAAGGNAGLASACHPTECRKFSIAELKRVCAFPDDYVLTGTYAQQWERLGNSVPPVMMMHVASALRDQVLLPSHAKAPRAPRRRKAAKGSEPKDATDGPAPEVMIMAQQIGANQVDALPHPSRIVIHDTAGQYRKCVPMTDVPCGTLVATGDNHFLVAGHGEGPLRIGRRPDGIERRKFTIAEAKRVCAFPDDYVLTGTYAQQWERLGNSVPPTMMMHIAAALRDQVLLPSREEARRAPGRNGAAQ